MGRVRLDAGIAEQRPGYFVYHFKHPVRGTWTSAFVGRTPRDANDGKHRIREEIDSTGTFRPENPRVSDLWEEYERVKTPTLAPSTMSDYRSIWRKVEMLGRLRVKDVTTDMLRMTLDRLDEPLAANLHSRLSEVHKLSEKRKHNITMFLKSLFSFAVDEGWLVRSPAAALKGRRFETPAVHVPSRADLVRLVEALPDEKHRTLVNTMLYTGLRLGEVIALQWNDWAEDGKVSRITVTRARSRGKVGPPKSGKPRIIPIPNWLRDDLRHWKSVTPHPHGQRDWIFPNKKGGPLCPDNFRHRVWKPACETAGLEGVRIHDLRHTYITWLVETGQPSLIIQSVAGHASLQTTQKYLDIREQAHLAIIEAFER